MEENLTLLRLMLTFEMLPKSWNTLLSSLSVVLNENPRTKTLLLAHSRCRSCASMNWWRRPFMCCSS